jgi:nucleoside-diphosphate-sugar epimerase
MTALADCVSACLLAAAKPGIAGEAFNIGARDTVSLREQVTQVMERAGVKPPRFLPIPGVLARHGLLLAYRLGLSKLEPDHVRLLDTDMVMDCRKAEAMLGWRSERTNVDMILETYEWYRTRGGTKK